MSHKIWIITNKKGKPRNAFFKRKYEAERNRSILINPQDYKITKATLTIK